MRIASTLLLVATLAGLMGCGPGRDTPPLEIMDDMKAQPKYKVQQTSPLFADKRASRKPPEGTVAVGHLYTDDASHYGVVEERYIGRNPQKITKELLAHGQVKFDTYCAPCHSRVADGKGIVGLRAGAAFQPANLHEPRIKQLNDGELYSVASDGRRTMSGYRNQTSDYDRWAIVAYLRVLQRATSGTIDDVPANLRSQLN